MTMPPKRLDDVDRRITAWMADYGVLLLRIALGIVFFWFGALKLVPGLSPAEDLVGRWMRVTLLLLFVQMAGTITPLFLFPAETWIHFPLVPTLEGQYIIKNIVLVSAAIVIGATVRGGQLTPEPLSGPGVGDAGPVAAPGDRE